MLTDGVERTVKSDPGPDSRPGCAGWRGFNPLFGVGCVGGSHSRGSQPQPAHHLPLSVCSVRWPPAAEADLDGLFVHTTYIIKKACA
eukprot:scaffold12625_cov107-Isochrysis_galbana.AAC.2